MSAETVKKWIELYRESGGVNHGVEHDAMQVLCSQFECESENFQDYTGSEVVIYDDELAPKCEYFEYDNGEVDPTPYPFTTESRLSKEGKDCGHLMTFIRLVARGKETWSKFLADIQNHSPESDFGLQDRTRLTVAAQEFEAIVPWHAGLMNLDRTMAAYTGDPIAAKWAKEFVEAYEHQGMSITAFDPALGEVLDSLRTQGVLVDVPGSVATYAATDFIEQPLTVYWPSIQARKSWLAAGVENTPDSGMMILSGANDWTRILDDLKREQVSIDTVSALRTTSTSTSPSGLTAEMRFGIVQPDGLTEFAETIVDFNDVGLNKAITFDPLLGMKAASGTLVFPEGFYTP